MNKFFIIKPISTLENSDGDHEVIAEDVRDEYHSMHELYQHRMALTFALLHQCQRVPPGGSHYPFKSKLHADGTMFEGYFICGIEYEGKCIISYHYKLEHWDKLEVDCLDEAPEYDGHGSKEVIERLLKL